MVTSTKYYSKHEGSEISFSTSGGEGRKGPRPGGKRTSKVIMGETNCTFRSRGTLISPFHVFEKLSAPFSGALASASGHRTALASACLLTFVALPAATETSVPNTTLDVRVTMKEEVEEMRSSACLFGDSNVRIKGTKPERG